LSEPTAAVSVAHGSEYSAWIDLGSDLFRFRVSTSIGWSERRSAISDAVFIADRTSFEFLVRDLLSQQGAYAARVCPRPANLFMASSRDRSESQ
jgi:hypothetical protein